jgi:phosphate transport system substrate-binding protein
MPALLLALSLLVLATPSAAAAPADDSEPIRIGGTGGALGVVAALADAYREQHPQPPIEILTSLGTGGGLRALAKGRLDIALASRPLTDAEQAGRVTHPFARTPLALVANADVTAEGLISDELIAIYRGERTEWPDGKRCRPILRPWNDAETILLAALSPQLSAALEWALRRPELVVTLTTQENLAAIAHTPGAFGYGPLAEILAAERGLKLLRLDGVSPTPAALAAGRYPVSETLTMVTNTTPRAQVKAFVDFVRSPEGEAVLATHGSMPARP